MPPSTNSASYLSHRNSFYSRRRQDSAGSASSCGSVKSKRKGSTPSSLSRSAIWAASQELARQEQATQSSSSSICSSSSCASTSLSASSSAISNVADAELKAPKSILLEDEYQEEAIQHMYAMESQTQAQLELMDVQPELRWFMRPYLVDFLIEIHQTFGLRAETLFLTLNIVDRYVSKRIVYKRHYQLVGCAALLIAAKYEDSTDRVPTVQELSQMCCSTYDESAFPQMEAHVLFTIGWTLGHPTAESWLRITCAQAGEPFHVQCIARLLMEITLFHRDFISVAPSAIAAGALVLARFIATQDAADFDKSMTPAAANAARLLDAYISDHVQDISAILLKKYSSAHFGSASSLVRDYYLRTNVAAHKPRTPESRGALLPAQLVGAGTSASIESDDDNSSELSRCTTPSSMASTPSRCAMDEDDEEDELPVTPLSLHSLHDPLLAAQLGDSMSRGKENLLPGSSSNGSLSGKVSLSVHQNAAPQVRAPLRAVSWDCNMQA